MWVVTVSGRGMAKLLCAAISRAREFLADAHAVELCRDPLSIAEALYKISEGYRGSFELPEGYWSLFILSPRHCRSEEQDTPLARLLSTHPPVAKRLKRLLTWASADINQLKERQKDPRKPKAAERPSFYARSRDGWKGPGTVEQLSFTGDVTPSTWISPADNEELTRARCNLLEGDRIKVQIENLPGDESEREYRFRFEGGYLVLTWKRERKALRGTCFGGITAIYHFCRPYTSETAFPQRRGDDVAAVSP